MKRWIVLGVLVALGTVSLAFVPRQNQPPAPKVVEAEKLKDNLYVLTGGGGATAVFITAKGVVVVDTKNPGWGQTVLDKIKTFTDKPVVTIINTHTHADHVGGNVEFPPNIDIVTQENTKSNMERMAPVTGVAQQQPATNIFKDNNGRGMPTRTFKDKMSLMSGNDRIDLYYFGRGHTNGDAFVVFPALRVMHAGDMFSGKNPPLLDANNGGSGVEIADSLAKAATGIKNVDAIITGHSKTMTWADLEEYVQFNRDFLADVKAARQAGKTPDAAGEEWKLPAKYQGYTAPPARVKANFQVIYDELKKTS
jgi:glyoxylase-like metal-dependent hydrolase (beta-lactamase superfamily II)